MIPFINSFLSYLLLMLIIAALAGLGTFIGITLRKRKNAKAAAVEEPAEDIEIIETSEEKKGE